MRKYYCFQRILSKIQAPLILLNIFIWIQVGSYSISKLFFPLLILKIFLGFCFYFIVLKNSNEQYFFANLGQNIIKVYLITLIIEFILVMVIFKLIQLWF